MLNNHSFGKFISISQNFVQFAYKVKHPYTKVKSIPNLCVENKKPSK